MTTSMPLAALAPAAYNPRKITPGKLQMLQKSLEHFGDLSGIVFNETSQTLVGGHQRSEIAQALGVTDIVIERRYDPPTKTGTVAEGYLMFNGERHSVRSVRWDDSTEKAANIAANKGAGEFDSEALAAIMADLKTAGVDLELTMFELEEQNKLFDMTDFTPQDVDWDEALDAVPAGEQSGIKTVTFTLSADQHATVMLALDAVKKLGPFVNTGNDNSNGNALARLAELHNG